MFRNYCRKYKVWFWVGLALFFTSGAFSNLVSGTAWEAALNAVLGACCLLVVILIEIQRVRQNKRERL